MCGVSALYELNDIYANFYATYKGNGIVFETLIDVLVLRKKL